MSSPPWKVGELARRTGLSVRALHHYDEIGLLEPSLRTPSGHRLYGNDDIARLQQIQSLRMTGIGLDEIRELLDSRSLSPLKVVRVQLERLQEQIAAQKQLVSRLTALAKHMETSGPVTPEELCLIIMEMVNMEKYFTTEQLAEIRARGERTTPERLKQVGEEWAEIIPAVRQHMAKGTDPADPAVQSLARRWKSLVNEFTGGNKEIARNLTTMYEQEGPALAEKLGNVPDTAMFAYMTKAFALLT